MIIITIIIIIIITWKYWILQSAFCVFVFL
jgi:hypothetical protein